MNAVPLLSTLLIALRKQRLEAVLIGNAAAALHGADRGRGTARLTSAAGEEVSMARRRGASMAARTQTRKAALAALARESDRQLDDLIRRRLALPLEKRANFLRRRLPGGGSCL